MRTFEQQELSFPTSYSKIIEQIHAVDPVKYGADRNYLNGSVSHLSPYISRGIISTNFVFTEVLKQGYQTAQIGKFIQELAWRDYWQQVWIAKGDQINSDLKHAQEAVTNEMIPKAIVNATTGIEAIDKGIQSFYETGYLHNHLRMYIASISCNCGQSYWKLPAKWMYYHLLDADWASNALSWQWVAGTNANKKYVANQENINNYCFTNQQNTFLDVPYESLPLKEIPENLKELINLNLTTPLPEKKDISIKEALPTIIYNFYNLDPIWKKDLSANRILLLEPSHFENYPVSQKTIDFVLSISKENISNVQIYVGEFHELTEDYHLKEIYYKEHPLNNHYKGIEEPREWMFDVKGYYPSFFAYWKKCKKQLSF